MGPGVRDDGVVALRHWSVDDVDAVRRARAGDGECARWLVDAPWPFRRADAERLVREAIGHSPRRGFAAVRLSDGELVGAALLLTFQQRPEIGYWIAPRHRRRGLGLRVARLIGEHARERSHEVGLVTHPDNVRSRRIAERLGFEAMGLVPYGPWTDGRAHGVLYVRAGLQPAATGAGSRSSRRR